MEELWERVKETIEGLCYLGLIFGIGFLSGYGINGCKARTSDCKARTRYSVKKEQGVEYLVTGKEYKLQLRIHDSGSFISVGTIEYRLGALMEAISDCEPYEKNEYMNRITRYCLKNMDRMEKKTSDDIAEAVERAIEQNIEATLGMLGRYIRFEKKLMEKLGLDKDRNEGDENPKIKTNSPSHVRGIPNQVRGIYSRGEQRWVY